MVTKEMNRTSAETNLVARLDWSRQNHPQTVQADQLLQLARTQLDSAEVRILDYVIAHGQQGESRKYVLETTLSELQTALGQPPSTFNQTKDMLLSLTNKSLWLHDEVHRQTVTAHWLSNVQLHDSGVLELQLDSQMVPYLLNIVEHQAEAEYYFQDVIRLRGKYSQRLYRLLRTHLATGQITATPRVFLTYFNQPDLKWYRFNDRYLKPALAEINAQTLLQVSMVTEKKGVQTKFVTFQMIHQVIGSKINYSSVRI